MQKDKLNTDYLLMKKKIVIHKDKHVHKWQGQNTIPDTKGQLFDCPQITYEITVLLLDQWRQSKWGKQSELLTIP